MAAKATKLFPVRGRWVHEAPYAVHVVETKGEADALIATGAFTDDPNDPSRDSDAPDLTASEPEPKAVPAADQPIEDVNVEPIGKSPQDAG